MSVAFFGPWIGEFGWELMTWQSFCRQEARRFDHAYVCSFPDMKPLYSDFADFIPHSHPTRALDWQKQENIDKANFDMPAGVTDVFMPFKKYKIEGEFIQFGRKGACIGYNNLIHARGIKRGGKDYPLDMWEKLCSDLPGTIACVGTEHDHHIPGTEDCRGYPLDNLMDLIANSGMVIGQSSGVMHLATLCGTPIVVWGDSKTYFYETLETRYKQTWNPFKVPVCYIADDKWKPSPQTITSIVKGAMGMSKKEEKAKVVAINDVPIPREIRDKLAKATQAGKYFITITCLAPDDKLYHFWKGHEFPHADMEKSLDHIAADVRKKLYKSSTSKLKPKPEVFQWT